MPANWGFLGIGYVSLYPQFAQLGSEIADSLRPTFEIFPFFGDASQRPGAISTAWCGTQSKSSFSEEAEAAGPELPSARQTEMPPTSPQGRLMNLTATLQGGSLPERKIYQTPN